MGEVGGELQGGGQRGQAAVGHGQHGQLGPAGGQGGGAGAQAGGQQLAQPHLGTPGQAEAGEVGPQRHEVADIVGRDPRQLQPGELGQGREVHQAPAPAMLAVPAELEAGHAAEEAGEELEVEDEFAVELLDLVSLVAAVGEHGEAPGHLLEHRPAEGQGAAVGQYPGPGPE